MKLTKRQFCLKYNFEIQLISSLIGYGIIKSEKVSYNREYIDEDVTNELKENIHYVCCPGCKKKMANVTKNHYRSCLAKSNESYCLYSEIFKEHSKKSDESKKLQSEILKERFKTPEGELTRKIIGENSRRINSNPDFLKRKSIISKEVQNRPENKKMRSIKSKEMWSDPGFLKKNKEYVENNKDALIKSAARARKSLNKTSTLHLNYKDNMVKKSLLGFTTEYNYKYYSIDEADPFNKIAIEIDGCYWHGCEKCGFKGDSRIINIDKRKETFLKNRGWIIIRIKEHDIKKDPFTGIEAIRSLQNRIKEINKDKIKRSFLKGSLKVKAMSKEDGTVKWTSISDVMCHNVVNKDMYKVYTEIGSVGVTEDHSLFLWDGKEDIKTRNLKIGDKIVGLIDSSIYEPVEITNLEKYKQERAYDISVPDVENFTLDSGILAHNSYSISGVSLDIDKSSKYESMKNNFLQEWESSRELIKASIKIIKGLRQPRYGIGISSALGPYSRPGTQSRRNFISGFRGGWA